MDHVFVVSKESLPNPRSQSLSSMFFYGSFIVLSSTSMTMIHFELISIYNSRYHSKSCFIYLFITYLLKFFQYHLLKTLSFLHLISFVTSMKINKPYIYIILFLVSIFCSINLFFHVDTKFTLYWLLYIIYYYMYHILESQVIKFLQIYSSFSGLYYFAILGHLHFHMGFRTSLSISSKKTYDFYWEYIRSIDQFGKLTS